MDKTNGPREPGFNPRDERDIQRPRMRGLDALEDAMARSARAVATPVEAPRPMWEPYRLYSNGDIVRLTNGDTGMLHITGSGYFIDCLPRTTLGGIEPTPTPGEPDLGTSAGRAHASAEMAVKCAGIGGIPHRGEIEHAEQLGGPEVRNYYRAQGINIDPDPLDTKPVTHVDVMRAALHANPYVDETPSRITDDLRTLLSDELMSMRKTCVHDDYWMSRALQQFDDAFNSLHNALFRKTRYFAR